MSSLPGQEIQCPDHNYPLISDSSPLLSALFSSDFCSIRYFCVLSQWDFGWGLRLGLPPPPPRAGCGVLPLAVPAGLGSRGDIVSVKKSVGRNRLLPQGLAVYASPENRQLFEEEKQVSHLMSRFVNRPAVN